MKHKNKKRVEELCYAIGNCCLGKVLVAISNAGICAIIFGNTTDEIENSLQDRFPSTLLTPSDHQMTSLVSEVIECINDPYKTHQFTFDERGTAFQLSVWHALRKIPVGKTTSYTEIAKAVGLPKAARAVANACGANLLAVFTPCHRVIKMNGSLSGYRWGVDRKSKLLQLEN
jgi:AraC family transcriptional regulator, regulatory protein of adaptative response / methylated-DNA-[protein]-cysteine methyltransferase